MYEFISSGLIELGHRVTIGPLIDSSAVNILWEGFVLPSFTEYDGYLSNYLEKESIVYGLIATEIADFEGGYFNHDTQYNRLRFKSFLSVAKNAQFIWSMVDKDIEKFSLYAPTFYIELGYSKLCEPDYIDKIEPIYDVGFFGLPNQYRIDIMEELTNKNKSIKFLWPNQYMLRTTEDLNLFISICRFGIHLKQHANWQYPSQSRLARYFTMNRQVISEKIKISTQKSVYCIGPTVESSLDEYFEKKYFDVSNNWNFLGREVGEKFRKNITIAKQIEEFFDTIKINNNRKKIGYHYIQPLDFSLSQISSGNLIKKFLHEDLEDLIEKKIRRSNKRKARLKKYIYRIKKILNSVTKK